MVYKESKKDRHGLTLISEIRVRPVKVRVDL